jgi:hypothetical protein
VKTLPAAEPETASTDLTPVARETASNPAETGPAPDELAIGSGETAPETDHLEAADEAEIAEIAREARNIVSDAAVDERPELYAHRLPSFGAEIVHWRPRGEREFRYLLRESFD